MSSNEDLGTIRLYYCLRLKATISLNTCKSNRQRPDRASFNADDNRLVRPAGCDNCLDWMQWNKQSPTVEIPVVIEKIPEILQSISSPTSFSSIENFDFPVKSSLRVEGLGSSFETSIGSFSDESLNEVDFSGLSSNEKEEDENESILKQEKGLEKKQRRIKRKEMDIKNPSNVSLSLMKKKRGRKSKAEKELILKKENRDIFISILKQIYVLKTHNITIFPYMEESLMNEENLSQSISNESAKTTLDNSFFEPFSNSNEQKNPQQLFKKDFFQNLVFEIEKKSEIVESEKTYFKNGIEEVNSSFLNVTSCPLTSEKGIESKFSSFVPNFTFSNEQKEKGKIRILIHADSLNAIEFKNFFAEKYPFAEIICPLTDFNFPLDTEDVLSQSIIQVLEKSWASHVINIHFIDFNLSISDKEKPKYFSFCLPNLAILKF